MWWFDMVGMWLKKMALFFKVKPHLKDRCREIRSVDDQQYGRENVTRFRKRKPRHVHLVIENQMDNLEVGYGRVIELLSIAQRFQHVLTGVCSHLLGLRFRSMNLENIYAFEFAGFQDLKHWWVVTYCYILCHKVGRLTCFR